jgi:hypothetical protein
MAQGRERAPAPKVLEQDRALQARDPHRQTLADPQMPGFPSDLVAELEQSNGDTANRAFIGARRRTDVRVDVAREVEATLRWRVDRSRDSDRRYGARLAQIFSISS